MTETFLLSKKSINLKTLFEERKQSLDHETLDDIFYDPSSLLEVCGLTGVLDDEPFKYIRTAGNVWEFYLLRFASKIGCRQYNRLIKPIPHQQGRFAGCSRRKLGNPYDIWPYNYPLIENRYLRKATGSFANKLVSRKCPIRQLKGKNDFEEMRNKAAKAYFKYLIGRETGRTITRVLFEELRGYDDFKGRLRLLVKTYPKNDLFITSGLMTCLYGGKNIKWVDAELAIAVAKALAEKCRTTPNPIVKNVYNILYSKKSNRDFRPPYKNIYDIKGGNRERVNINFRIQTWLKLLEDTLHASK